MTDRHFHPPDETLLLYADAELSAEHGGEVSGHLRTCNLCTTRLQELTNSMAEFSQAYRQSLPSEVPTTARARAALLSQLGTTSPRKSRFGWVSAITPARQGYIFATVVLAFVFTLAIYRREIRSESEQVSASLDLWSEPKNNLTPGATLAVTKAQVCAASSGQVPAVPVSLQHKVLALYGVSSTQSDAYEVDYLITPELGGATDVRNLWPEPYFDTDWNAHVKDQLEDRLHEMVCRGDVDLATAQQDISKDWIAAYRKYFHTDKPLPGPSLHRV